MPVTLTLVVHGTFAADAGWWRLGGSKAETFADRLDVELSRRGLAGTVWKPAVSEGFDYSSFAWSGRNRHRDRIKAAHRLGSSLNQLAERLNASADEPLTVNLVAHSHGGNVVLEALRHLGANVRVGRIALLGTPLVNARPAFRFARFLFSVLLLGFLFLGFLLVFIEGLSLIFSQQFSESERFVVRDGQTVREVVNGGVTLLLFIPALIAYAWSFWGIGNLLDLLWRAVCLVMGPLALLRGKSRSLVYGPSPGKLEPLLGGAPILLLTARNDEADLLLQTGSAPARLYREYVATHFSAVGRFLELALVRPLVQGVLLKAVEMFLEGAALGFSRWKTLFVDYTVADLVQRPYYPAHLLVHRRIVMSLFVPTTESRPALATLPLQIVSEEPRALHVSLAEIIGHIKEQVRLRHSAYYENPPVIEYIAEFLAGGQVEEPVRVASSPPSERELEKLVKD